MAEVLKYQSGQPSFSEILEILSRWNERKLLTEQEREQAKKQLELCLEALKQKSDGMSGMVHGKVRALLRAIEAGASPSGKPMEGR